jgi:hypothetical protein
VIAVLARLGFLPKNKALETYEMDLVHDLWTVTRGDEQQGVSFDTLRTLCLNFIGLKTKNQGNKHEETLTSAPEGHHASPGESEIAPSD